MSRIVNLKHEPGAVADGAVRIDRRTPWGNPFVIGRDGDREAVIARYRADLWRRIRAGETDLEALAALHGRDLACHCAPAPCHGEVLQRASAWAAARLGGTDRLAPRQPAPAGGIDFSRVGGDEFRIRDDENCCIGSVYKHEDILRPGSFFFVIHLIEDWRGPQRVHNRRDVRERVQRLVDTHPLW